MTPVEFAAALTDRLHRKGVDFRPKDVEAFAADAWARAGRSPELDAWAERFLAAQPQERFARKRQGAGTIWTGVIFIMLGLVGSLTLLIMAPMRFAYYIDENFKVGLCLVVLSLLPVGVFLIVAGLSFRYWPVHRQGSGLIRYGLLLTAPGILTCLLITFCACFCPQSLFIAQPYVAITVYVALLVAVLLLPFGLIPIIASLSFRYWPDRRRGGGLIRVGLLCAVTIILWHLLWSQLKIRWWGGGNVWQLVSAGVSMSIRLAPYILLFSLILATAGLLARCWPWSKAQ